MTESHPFMVPILLSALATFLVRALPYYATFLDRLPKFLSKSLKLLPIAALGPLIFPGVILDYQQNWYAGLLGILAASIFAYRKRGMIIPILLSIGVTYLALLV
ncbi:AzlD domain-containing protein [Sphaerochaeta globosa]|uniref:Branched-chain amino acid transport n=1 Tax=Sphaerochaeta globosa (strain ATCC BAA-1886 / DSM 22777 / Buddy) TaxID=158189 RepID=F0RVG3_SPHGB|nr:AzlD domain-containing protein [Sphaerochaeta globosa]ADY12955.1 branched-chain amino acid transport [Sphaerochaeta globosa str. Buddy]